MYNLLNNGFSNKMMKNVAEVFYFILMVISVRIVPRKSTPSSLRINSLILLHIKLHGKYLCDNLMITNISTTVRNSKPRTSGHRCRTQKSFTSLNFIEDFLCL